MSVVGIQGHLLEVTVVSCSNLKDKEWISRQDPYVCIEYATNKFRTRTCTDGGKNPVFQEKFMVPLIEGLREIQVAVWNSNTINSDDFIGNSRVLLDKALREGYDDCTWPLQSRSGRHAGELRLILHYANAKKQGYCSYPSVPSHVAPTPPYGAPPPLPYPGVSPYPSQPAPSAYPPNPTYPPAAAAYPPTAAYPPAGYPPSGTYPPAAAAYPPAYPSAPYPPAASSVYPPPPQTSYPQFPPTPGSYSGTYPPPYH